jgi:hypothetical protein
MLDNELDYNPSLAIEIEKERKKGGKRRHDSKCTGCNQIEWRYGALFYPPARVFSMNFTYVSFGAAPTVLDTSFPPLNRSREGIDLIPYFIAIS